ncbi:DNA-binding transcriptional activator of the SARP family [Parafrankia irregularis]|uniref:DNA-binding transcriptional activator of the SARP family n=1 Tax=Parafrankia irregularis TaxID=795642 RepID=A0A0S4QRI6_9ACTN|nr:MULTISPECIES: AfsR/SARP family transcriptional regulator [Parafrankia]MBE3201879.1 AfsR/SARP family transcriptional regulator [Parafrankia sp. CH37]CUU58363.1 DNA-binding transcriptional activator of the SARP family [Parafrankia irregularis]
MESRRHLPFRILGPVEVSAPDGSAVPIAQPKKRRLLSLLLLVRGRWASTEHIRAVLWDVDPPPSAVGNIKTYVSDLRQVLPEGETAGLGRIQGRHGAYRLNAAATEVDVWLFEDLARRGQDARWNGDAARAVELLGDALAVWRGEPYEDLPEEVVRTEAARLRELRAVVHEDLADALLDRGQYDRALPMLRALTLQYPLRERLWEQFLVAASCSGHRADALVAYRTAYHLLSQELGVEPSVELRRIHAQVLAGEPAETAAARRVRHGAGADHTDHADHTDQDGRPRPTGAGREDGS